MRKFKIGDKITLTQYRDLHANRGTKQFVKHTLMNGEKVYIDKLCNIPRKKFKISYPDNPIVYNPEQADVFIATDSIFDYGRTTAFNGRYYSSVDEVTVERHHLVSLNRAAYKEYIYGSTKPLVKDTDFFYKGELPREMTRQEYLTIAKMLTADDKEMLQLGINMLLGFDVSMNEEYYVLALAQVNRRYNLPGTRIFKSIKKRLKKKYVNLQ